MIEEEGVRRDRLEALRAIGVDPYPSRVARTHTCAEFLEQFDALVSQPATVVGRTRLLRRHGGMAFLRAEEGSTALQFVLKKDILGETAFEQFLSVADLGDFVQASGTSFTTQKGERSLLVSEIHIIAKSLLPLPEKWHGLTDVEARYRKRYLDLLMHPEVREAMQLRSRAITAMRQFLDARGFLEVETPTLQPIYGGGFARPFVTHHHALDADFYLRISDEMYLKRLLVGGFEKVYEITKVFRNEGIDRDHNPEFTMFEAQMAYTSYEDGMNLFEELGEYVARETLGTTDIQHGEQTIHLVRPWKRLRLVEAVETIGGISVSTWTSVEQARSELRPRLRDAKRTELDRMHTVGEVIAFAFEELVEDQLIQPTLVYDYPIEVSPLAKKSKDPRFTERFEVFALGSEMGNNYTELNDPVDLEKRFIEEKKREQAGFDEAHQTDWDYLEAIKHGMPPACGLGMGVDRFVALLAGVSNIKDVLLFPTLRPIRGEGDSVGYVPNVD